MQAAELGVPGTALPGAAQHAGGRRPGCDRQVGGFAPSWGAATPISCLQKLPFVFGKRHLLGRLHVEDLRFLSLQRKVLDKGGIWLGSDRVGEWVSCWFLEDSAEKSWVHGGSAARAACSSLQTWCLCTGGRMYQPDTLWWSGDNPPPCARVLGVARNTRVPGTAPRCPWPVMPRGHDRAQWGTTGHKAALPACPTPQARAEGCPGRILSTACMSRPPACKTPST